MPTIQDILGNGLRFPMVRTGSDFQTSNGEDLVFCTVPYILETQANSPRVQGEIPWDSSFGSQLQRLKHKNIVGDSAALNELARTYIVEALAINEPRLIVRAVRANFLPSASGNRLDFHVRLAAIETDVDANDVRISNDVTLAFGFSF